MVKSIESGNLDGGDEGNSLSEVGMLSVELSLSSLTIFSLISF